MIVKTDCEIDGSFYSTTPPPSTLHFTQDVEKIKLQPSKTLHGQGAAPASSQLGEVSGQDEITTESGYFLQSPDKSRILHTDCFIVQRGDGNVDQLGASYSRPPPPWIMPPQ